MRGSSEGTVGRWYEAVRLLIDLPCTVKTLSMPGRLIFKVWPGVAHSSLLCRAAPEAALSLGDKARLEYPALHHLVYQLLAA